MDTQLIVGNQRPPRPVEAGRHVRPEVPSSTGIATPSWCAYRRARDARPTSVLPGGSRMSDGEVGIFSIWAGEVAIVSCS